MKQWRIFRHLCSFFNGSLSLCLSCEAWAGKLQGVPRAVVVQPRIHHKRNVHALQWCWEHLVDHNISLVEQISIEVDVIFLDVLSGVRELILVVK